MQFQLSLKGRFGLQSTLIGQSAVGRSYPFLERLVESQSRPSYSPSPDVAQVDWMYQLRWRSECKPSLSVISAAFMALGRSCLLANTNRTASRSSSSFSMR